ncbi:uncharacterized protein LOC122261410 [Penaeus japonicus]|uniref:uncharacterized protein LOC122248779 n=1 Tax=Penaeus japonicus TaxID=27405 RepID=UPI001C710FB6|nr:uncharacterized protein LOC122248779 [Penaeus japonicus]XP_042884971.1 uncharacterized protein LOC122261410 [Penaeus japonicus]
MIMVIKTIIIITITITAINKCYSSILKNNILKEDFFPSFSKHLSFPALQSFKAPTLILAIEPEIGRRASSLASSPLSDSAPETEDLYYRLSPSDPYRFEYHTLQLEKFLKEYRRLQEQLLYMKQSYETEQRVKSTPRLDDWLEAEEARRGVAFGPCERRASRRPSEPLKSILKKSSSTDGRRLPRRQRTSSLQIVDAREWYRGLEDS